jgi:hypothetical protein
MRETTPGPATQSPASPAERQPGLFWVVIPWWFGVNAAVDLTAAGRLPSHSPLGLAGEIVLVAALVAYLVWLVATVVRRSRN